ncbi:MAG: hypothetical protein HXX20_20865 [Chloroflexi bacterium]|nr:hypothetical protein [Chloroflexota bacterium]
MLNTNLKHQALWLPLIVALFLVNFQPEAAYASPFLQTSSTAEQTEIYSDGETLVWTGYKAGDTNHKDPDIYGLKLKTGQEFLIAGGPAAQGHPEVSGNFVIWVDYTSPMTIRGKDLESGQEFVVVPPKQNLVGSAHLSGTRVHWLVVQGNNYSVMGRDISPLGEPFVVLPQVFVAQYNALLNFSVVGQHVVWQTINSYSRDIDCRLYIQKIGTTEYKKLANTPIPAACTISWTGSGNTLIYADLQAIPLTIYDLESEKVLHQFKDQFTGTRAIAFKEPYLFWKTTAYPSPTIMGYDLATDSLFEAVSTERIRNFDFSGGLVYGGERLFWLEKKDQDQNGPITLASIPLSEALPTAARSAPTNSDPTSYYFRESKHYLKDRFKDYWDHNGGLAVFGFPFTEQLMETNPDDSKNYTVQYLERQRFEYHPENAGTLYEILLGLLGKAEANHLGLTTTAPFAPVNATRVSTDCTFFAAVGHSLCGKFYAYWRSHGLEFGDSGVSTREALALFGYPISESYLDPVSGLTIQYFERSRFEYHPENAGTPYEVLLGRLAINTLTARGWLQE